MLTVIAVRKGIYAKSDTYPVRYLQNTKRHRKRDSIVNRHFFSFYFFPMQFLETTYLRRSKRRSYTECAALYRHQMYTSYSLLKRTEIQRDTFGVRENTSFDCTNTRERVRNIVYFSPRPLIRTLEYDFGIRITFTLQCARSRKVFKWIKNVQYSVQDVRVLKCRCVVFCVTRPLQYTYRFDVRVMRRIHR